MNKKLFIMPTLRDKRGSHCRHSTYTNLANIFDAYLLNPDRDYTLQCYQTTYIRASTTQGFQQGYNPLDKWIQTKVLSNKQNISDTQPRKQIPQQLLKYINPTPHQKNKKNIKQYSNKCQNANNQTQQNIDIKEICREYAENKKNGKHSTKEPPIWKFSSKQGQQFQQQIPNQSRTIITKKIAQQLQHTNQPTPYTKPPQQLHDKLQNQQKQQQIIQAIKNNLAHQIQTIAQKIIQCHKNCQQSQHINPIQYHSDPQSQPSPQIPNPSQHTPNYNQNQQHHFQQQDVSFSDPIQPQKTSPKKQNSAHKQKIHPQENQHVGYSFSSEFNACSQVHEDTNNKQKCDLQPIKEITTKIITPDIHSDLVPNQQVPHPKICQIQYQLDNPSKTDHQPNINTQNQPPNQPPIIDIQSITKIKLILYNDANNQKLYTNEHPNVDEQINELSSRKKQEKKSKKSLSEVSKTVLSIQDQNDHEDVNISVSNEKQQQKELPSKYLPQPQIPLSEVHSMKTSGIGQLKKQPKQHQQLPIKRENNRINEGNINPSYNYVHSPISDIDVSKIVPTKIIYSPPLHPPLFQSNIPSTLPHKIYNPITLSVQSTPHQTPTSIPISNQYYRPYQGPSTTITPSLQNLPKQLNTSLKNSKQQQSKDSRKIKITISPKYTDKQPDKHDLPPDIADFKIVTGKIPQTNQNYTLDKFQYQLPGPYTYVNQMSLPKTNLNSILVTKNSINTATNSSLNKFKVDNIFLNPTINTTIQILPTTYDYQLKKKSQDIPLINTQKYQKTVQRLVEPTQSNKSSISIKNKQSLNQSKQFQFDFNF